MTKPAPSDAYNQALAWLYQQRRDGRPRHPRVARELLDALGIPDPPRVIHVVGTNGKGTVSHMLAAMAQAQGWTVGRFTSPHVEDFRERINVAGSPIEPERVTAFVERVKRGSFPGVGFFEWTLALALASFNDGGVDLAVLEAGVGARFDATLAVGNVIGGVLTNVGLDHLETLGPTLADIAEDKAAVARPGVPIVSATEGEARSILERRARAVGAPLQVVHDGHPLAAWPAEGAPAGPATRLENARLAVALARILGWREEALLAGLRAPPPPGRFERFVVPWRDAAVNVILDGAHDPSATARLRPDLPPAFVLLYAQLERKRMLTTLAPLLDGVQELVWTRADADDADPRSWAVAPEGVSTLFEPDLERALPHAFDAAAALQRDLVITGSLHLAGGVRPWLRAHGTHAGEREDAVGGAMLAGR